MERFADHSGFLLLENFLVVLNDCAQLFQHCSHLLFFRMKQPPLIKTRKQLKTEITLLEMLSNIEVGIRTISKGIENVDLNPVDRHYENMKCALSIVSVDDTRYKVGDARV